MARTKKERTFEEWKVDLILEIFKVKKEKDLDFEINEIQIEGLDYALSTLTENQRLSLLYLTRNLTQRRACELIISPHTGKSVSAGRVRQIYVKALRTLQHISFKNIIKHGVVKGKMINNIPEKTNPIETLELRFVVYGALKRSSYDTVEEVLNNLDCLRSVKGIGEKAYSDIINSLVQHNYLKEG